MTANRVVTDHGELENSGQLTHSVIDSYINNTTFVVVSGSVGDLPPGARRLVASSPIIISDGGPGGDLTIGVSGLGSGSSTSIRWNDVPTGANDGVNKAFTLTFSPLPPQSLMFFINGIKQMQGADSDYTLTGSLVNLIADYRSGSNIDATYPY
jgi:hypothetical protein